MVVLTVLIVLISTMLVLLKNQRANGTQRANDAQRANDTQRAKGTKYKNLDETTKTTCDEYIPDMRQ